MTRLDFSHVNYDRLPVHMQEAMRLYIEEGLEPGGFGVAVLSNKLVEAFNRADDVNTMLMNEWARWLYGECPGNACGSADAVSAWMTARREEQQQEGGGDE